MKLEIPLPLIKCNGPLEMKQDSIVKLAMLTRNNEFKTEFVCCFSIILQPMKEILLLF